MIHSDNNIPIIYYHSVGTKNPVWANNFLTLELVFFEDQLRYFRKYFRVISLSEYQEIRSGLRAPVKNSLVITFDDGYLDNWIWGFPLLKKYNLPAAIFVCPEFVDPRPVVRPTLEDVWNGKCTMKEIMQPGYLSWEEMKVMERSGLVSIQSHTMSHTKYFVSGTLRGFHPGFESYYAACNIAPDRKPYSISDPDFKKILPPGFPLFEEQSAVTARKVEINKNFISGCTELFRDYDFSEYDFSAAKKKTDAIYSYYAGRNELITKKESEEEYNRRLEYEISQSKAVIEKKLDKKVDFLCWPHGDNTREARKMALNAGYKGVTAGNLPYEDNEPGIIPARIGIGVVRNSRHLTLRKAKFKLNRFLKKFPDYHIYNIYQKIRNR